MKIGIMGTGAYGLALAKVLSTNNHDIVMWTKLEQELEELNSTRQNHTKLPDVILPEHIRFTSSLKECFQERDLILWAIPTDYLESTLAECKSFFEKDQVLALTSKGINEDGTLLHEIFLDQINTSHLALLSGPSFASELVLGFPTGLTLSCTDEKSELVLKEAFAKTNVKLRVNHDLIGTAICGFLKNVLAIASGMLNGLSATESTKAMFLTEALHDLKTFIKACGGDGSTILSYAGFGDILLTCSSNQSRNYQFGELIATTDQPTINHFLSTHTVEGLSTLIAVKQKMDKEHLDLPLVELIYEIVSYQKEPYSIFSFLLSKE